MPLQNAALSIYGRRLSRVRYGPVFEERLEFLRGTESWDRGRVLAHQDEKIAETVSRAYHETAYYRRVMDERGLKPADMRGAADLPKLPVLTKELIRENFGGLIASSAPKRKLIEMETSGSTGAPLRTFMAPEDVSFQWAVWWRHRERFGFRRGTSFAAFTTKPLVSPTQSRPPYWRWDHNRKHVTFPMQQIVPAKIEAITEFLEGAGFEFYVGYPSILHSLATIALSHGLQLSEGPTHIFTGAERMFDDQRHDLELFTGATVSQMYGFNEAAGNASECELGRLHEDFEFGFLECAEPHYDPESGTTSGKILATGFGTTAFPLIRYDVGDAGVWRPDDYECECGRGSRVLDAVVGRWEDYVVTPEGHQARRLGEIFKHLPGLTQFQIVQTDPTRITVRLVVKPGYTLEDEDTLRRRVGAWISPTLDVDFEYEDAIAPGSGGKYHRIVNRVGRESGPSA